MNLSKTATALALIVALAGTLAAAPQATKSTTPAKAATPAKSTTPAAKPAAMKPDVVKPADLPKPVTDAVMKAHPKGEITTATKTMAGDTAWYTVSVKVGAKTSKMTLDAMGMPKPAAKKK